MQVTPMDKYSDLFTLPAAAYRRDVNVLEHYLDDASSFLARQRNIPKETARDWIKRNARASGAFPLHDPKVTYLQRRDNGDREKLETTLTRFIASSVKDEELIAPTFTTYLSPKKKKSLLSDFLAGNVKLRAQAKKAQFAAEAEKNLVLAAIKKVEQTFRKLNNNAVSGAHVSPSTPLYNRTGHSTLTSTCRTTSSYGNANNEKFISGNRHYFSANIVLNNIQSIIGNVDYDKITAAMTRHGLKYPSHDEVMQAIRYSANLYWWDDHPMSYIEEFVRKLQPQECAAFLYVGDAFQLMQHNSEMMRGFMTQLSKKVSGQHPDPDKVLKSAPEPYVNLAHQICHAETQGIGKNYDKIRATPAYHTLALTVENIASVIFDHFDLVDAFWRTSNVPSSVANVPTSVRRSAITSDTDSTIFTVQDWVIWYTGGPSMDQTSRAVAASVVMLAAVTITNILAIMSANLGIVEDDLFKIAMKSEYMFDTFITTMLGKHYWAVISAQEGNVKAELEWEIKGVQLKSANAPRNIITEANKMMKEIIMTVMNGKKISMRHYLHWVGAVENQIVTSIKKGQLSYLRNASIKDPESYTKEAEESPYQHYFLWQEVFAPKYGNVAKPPYDAKKISVQLDTPTKLKKWLAEIEDRDLAQRMQNYLARNGKTNLTMLLLPMEKLVNQGIPPEIEQVLDYPKIVVDICATLYIILEALGYHTVGERRVTRLISDDDQAWGDSPEFDYLAA